MTIINHDIIGSQMSIVKTQQGLNVSVSGPLQITISAGNINGIAINNDAVLNFDVVNYNRYCEIYFLKKLSDGTGEIWRDLRKVDRPCALVPDGYEIVEKLCWFMLPANTTDLNSIIINVRRIL